MTPVALLCAVMMSQAPQAFARRVSDAAVDTFPVPREVHVDDPEASREIASSFTIVSESSTPSDVMVAAIKRYSAIIPTSKK